MRVVASERGRGRLNAERSRKSLHERRVAARDWVVFLTRERKPVLPAEVVVDIVLQ